MIWTAIKLFGGKILKSKVGGIVSNLFSGWQLYLLLGVLFGGCILKLKLNVWSGERKLKSQIEKTIKVQAKLDTKILHYKTCKKVNTEVNEDLVRAVELANQCNDLFTESKERNEAQIQLMNERKRDYEKQIEDAKNIEPVTTCDFEPLNKADSDWLLGKGRPDIEDGT